MSGSVRRIEAYGVLIGIDDTRISALLHISATSRAHIENMFVSGLPNLCYLMTQGSLTARIDPIGS